MDGRWRGGIKQFGGLLIDVGARTQTAIVIQMEQNRGAQINPRLITPLWAVSVWVYVSVSLCVCVCVFGSACRCTTLQATGKKELSHPPTGPLHSSVVGRPLFSRATHTHRFW